MAASVALAAFVVGSSRSDAQVARTGGTSQATQQLQQLAQERTALQAENARLKKELEQAQADAKSARAEREALKARAAGADASAARLKSSNEASEQSLQASRQKLDELVARFRETAQTLRSVEADGAAAKQKLDERSRELDRCAVANAGLFEIADQTLSLYEKAATKHAEPFTGLARVRAENLVDGYRERAQALKTHDTAAPAAAPQHP
jgi:chromosome segregation ATPase